MITIINKDNRHLHKPEMDEMFRQRHRVFVQELGWSLPLAHQGREMDQFDREDTLYILLRDKWGNLIASKRLIPTVKPHLLSDIFPHLVEQEVPRAASIWESSRTCVPREHRRCGVTEKLFLAMMETALLMGIEKITFVSSTSVYPIILDAGWTIQPLGLPQKDLDDEEIIAAAIEVSPGSLRQMRRRYSSTHVAILSLPLDYHMQPVQPVRSSNA